MLHLLIFICCLAGFYYLLISQKNHARTLFKREPQAVGAHRVVGFLLLFVGFGLSSLSPDYGFYMVAWFGDLTLAAACWAVWLFWKTQRT